MATILTEKKLSGHHGDISILLVSLISVISSGCVLRADRGTGTQSAQSPVAERGAPAAAVSKLDRCVNVQETHDNGLTARFYMSAGRAKRSTVLMLAGSGGGFPPDAAARDLCDSGYHVLAL